MEYLILILAISIIINLFFITIFILKRKHILDIGEKKKLERTIEKQSKILEIIHQLNNDDKETTSYNDILAFIRDKTCEVTASPFGFIAHYDDKLKKLYMNSWSKEIMADCHIMEKNTSFDLNKTGLWTEAIRQKKAIIVNDYEKENPLKKGLPTGHLNLKRFMAIPIIRGNIPVAILAVANKKDAYDHFDQKTVEYILEASWNMISHKKSSQKKFNDEKLQSVGVLSAGMAHEINSPLAIIRGNIRMLQAKNNFTESELSKINNINQASLRIEEIIKALQNFTKRQKNTTIETIDLIETINDIIELIRIIAAPKKITITCQNDMPQLKIKANSAVVEHVISNLVTNSITALENCDKGQITLHTYQNNGTPYLAFSDNGRGIDPKLADQIFDPFFTTNEVGKGAGLGLSACKSLMESIGGDIRLEDNSGTNTITGASFILSFTSFQT